MGFKWGKVGRRGEGEGYSRLRGFAFGRLHSCQYSYRDQQGLGGGG